MLLQNLYPPGRIKVRLEAEDKEEVFEELVDLLVNNYRLDARDEILAAIRAREQKMTTGIKKGIAIPHAKTAAVAGVKGVLGVSDKGIEYESLDGEPVHLLFLIVSSEEDAGEHLRILKNIALLVENSDFYTEILRSKDAEQAYRLIQKYEEILDFQEE